MKEIERKFLLKEEIFDLLKQKPTLERKKLTQYYTKVTPQKSVRFRKEDHLCFKTVKKGKGGVREEIERVISFKKYEKNLSLHRGRIIRKLRYFLPLKKYLFTIDIYKKPFEGLYVMEVEFEDEKSYSDFVMPKEFADYVQKEITFEEAYKNKNLALFGLPLEKESSHQALADVMRVLEKLRQKIEEYAQKIVEGTSEEEDLHQFRIGLRKSVIFLDLFAFLCQQKSCLEYKKRLKKMISLTNLKRDLDVMQAWLEKLKGSLYDERLIEAVVLIEQKIGKEAWEEEERIVSFLKGERFTQTMQEYGLFVSSLYQKEASFYASYHVEDVVKYVIFTQYLTIKKRIKKLDGKEEDASLLHRLRIDFKKLRYLLESFGRVVSKKQSRRLLKEMKKMQNILGTFHDSFQYRKMFVSLLESEKEGMEHFLIEYVVLPRLGHYQKEEIGRISKKISHFLEQEGTYRRLFS